MTKGIDYLWKPSRVAQHLDVSARTVVRWIHEGKLSGEKVGRVWRVRESEVRRVMRDGL